MMSNFKEEFKSMIKISNLSKNYKLGDVSICALDKVSFAVDFGEIVFIMGPSGS